MENEENKNLQGRRDFFKEAARKALPIFGFIALMSNPIIARAVENDSNGCTGQSCTGGCYGGCEGCRYSCTGTCKGGCNGCQYTCEGTCQGACKARCTYGSNNL